MFDFFRDNFDFLHGDSLYYQDSNVKSIKLTTSSKPGYAMKADPPHARTIVGKAMEPIEEGEGIIMVFVTRQ